MLTISLPPGRDRYDMGKKQWHYQSIKERKHLLQFFLAIILAPEQLLKSVFSLVWGLSAQLTRRLCIGDEILLFERAMTDCSGFPLLEQK